MSDDRSSDEPTARMPSWARAVVVVALAATVIGLLMAPRGWRTGSVQDYLIGLFAAVFGIVLLLIMIIPARAKIRLLAGGVAGIVAIAVVIGVGVLTPSHAVTREQQGTGVDWSIGLPTSWDRSEEAASDAAVGITVVNDSRAVLRRGSDVAVVNLTDGQLVRSFTYGSGSVDVIRTVDGFGLNDEGRLMFYSTDGAALTKQPIETSTEEDRLVARLPGVTVVARCQLIKHCALQAVTDHGATRWQRSGYAKSYGDILPITDQMPAYSYRHPEVLGEQILGLRNPGPDRPSEDKPRSFDQLDPKTGRTLRRFSAVRAGTSLPLSGSPQPAIFAVSKVGDSDQCRLTVWPDDGAKAVSPSFGCDPAGAVSGNRVIFPVGDSADNRLTSSVVDLRHPKEVDALNPEARQDGLTQPLSVQETGPEGSALEDYAKSDRLGATTRADPRSVTAGVWGTSWSDRWQYTAEGRVTGTWLGGYSVLVESEIRPINPFDHPSSDARTYTVLRLGDGRQLGTTRLNSTPDDIAPLGAGQAILATSDRVIMLGRP